MAKSPCRIDLAVGLDCVFVPGYRYRDGIDLVTLRDLYPRFCGPTHCVVAYLAPAPGDCRGDTPAGALGHVAYCWRSLCLAAGRFGGYQRSYPTGFCGVAGVGWGDGEPGALAVFVPGRGTGIVSERSSGAEGFVAFEVFGVLNFGVIRFWICGVLGL